MLPWGPLEWLLSKLPLTGHSLKVLTCLSPEDRCRAIALIASQRGASSIQFLKIQDPSSRFSQKIEEKVHVNYDQLVASNIGPLDIQTLGLFAADEEIALSLKRYLTISSDSAPLELWIDITCMPKRFFFLLVKLALDENLVQTLVVTYTQPSPGRYTDEHLAEDPEDVQPLPGFGPNTEDPDTVVVAVGFESLGLPQFLGEYRDKRRDIYLLLPFPPGQPYSRRIWSCINNVGDSGIGPNIKRVPSIDAFEAYHQLASICNPHTLRTKERPPALAPYGPKPVSLGMCLYAIQTGAPVFYTQPRVYHPDYTIGIGKSWGYCLKLVGKQLWRV